MIKNLPAMWETWVQSLGGKIPWRRERLSTPVFWPREFHGLYSPWDHKESDMTERLSLFTFRASQVVLEVKNLPDKAGDVTAAGSISGSGRSPGGGKGNPLQ